MRNTNVAGLRSDIESSIIPDYVVPDFSYCTKRDSKRLVPHWLNAFEIKKHDFYFEHQQNLDLDIPETFQEAILGIFSGNLPLAHQVSVCQILRQLQVAYVAQWKFTRFLVDGAVVLADWLALICWSFLHFIIWLSARRKTLFFISFKYLFSDSARCLASLLST